MTSLVWPPTDGQDDLVLKTMTPERETRRGAGGVARGGERGLRSPQSGRRKKADERAGREMGLAVYAGRGDGQSSQSGRLT